MKRLLILLAVASLVMAVTVTPSASAAKADKVDICHVNSSADVIPAGPNFIAFGRVISVSEKAVPGHMAHGDSPTIYFVADVLPGNADCWFLFSVYPE